MAPLFIDRHVNLHFTRYPGRPIVGGVLHDTEGATSLTVAQSLGSWHWLIGRDGLLYRDVAESHAAWHVYATGHSADSLAHTRWRPPWLIVCPDGGVSDTNYCTVGIELVSDATARVAGEPYTDAQYATLRALVTDIEAQHGALPWVGHGELQTDRTDPVQFDWERAGFGPRGPMGRAFIAGAPAAGEPTMPTLTPAELVQVAQLVWDDIPFNPAFAIPGAWLAAEAAGRYLGGPVAGEADTADGTMTVQVFTYGRICYRKATGETITMGGTRGA